MEHAEIDERYNPWTVVNIVFHHLAGQGLHPTLGTTDPGVPAAQLLRALGIEPDPRGDPRLTADTHDHLAQLREAVFGSDT